MAVTEALPETGEEHELEPGEQAQVPGTEKRQMKLTFDVGGETPEIAILRLSGGIVLERELKKGAEIHIEVTDTLDGQVVANGYGRVTSVRFDDKLDEDGYVQKCERITGIKVS